MPNWVSEPSSYREKAIQPVHKFAGSGRGIRVPHPKAGPWEVEYTDELGTWWAGLTEAGQESIDAAMRLLEAKGPNNLGFPHAHVR